MESTEVKVDQFVGLAQSLKFEYPEYMLSKYHCTYCGKICLEALQAKCKHLFCGKCLVKLLKDAKECPLDKTTIVEQEVKRNDTIRKEIENLQVYCPFRSSGCQLSEKLFSIPKHLQSCEHAPLQCPQGCDQPVEENNLEQHLQFFCAFRHVSCDYCSISYVLAFKEKHLEECLRYPQECPNECGIPSFPHEELSQHLKECSVQLQLCRHQHLGCKYQGVGSALRQHEEDLVNHFQLMATGYAYLNLNFDILMEETRGNVLLLQNENMALRETLKMLTTQCEILSESEDDIQEKLSLLRVTTYKLMKNKELFSDEIEATKDRKPDNEKTNETSLSDDILKQLKTVQEMKFKIQDEMTKRIERQEEKIQTLTAVSHCNGEYLWKITDYYRRKEESLSRRRPFEFSEPFFTERYGYQLCGKVYLGGEGEARGTHLSLYIIVMRGPYDNLLAWPFPHKFHMSILDQKHTHQKQHRSEIFSPNHGSSFQKPTGIMNTGAGLTRFVSSLEIESGDTYLRNDTIYIKMSVIPADLGKHRGKHKKSSK